MNEKSLIQVAKLGKTIGLKGYVKLHNLSDFPEQFKKNANFFCKDAKSVLKIKDYNLSNNTALFEGFESIKEAKKLTNLILYQSIEQSRKTCKLKKDEFFYFDILECEIIDSKQKLGKVIDILEVSNSYLFEISTDEKLVKQGLAKNFFVPYNDKFIKKIDTEKKLIECEDEAFLILENS
ncbi:MAG: 16S rRNA processing protein RimM [Campylobacter sp.]|nr:16S rRNA processing protein RimM [Campylobacter sp.]